MDNNRNDRNNDNRNEDGMSDKVVTIKRVTKVVKGGRNMRFSALVVVGDSNGKVGVGLGKATEIPEAIRKGREDAAKHLKDDTSLIIEQIANIHV